MRKSQSHLIGMWRYSRFAAHWTSQSNLTEAGIDVQALEVTKDDVCKVNIVTFKRGAWLNHILLLNKMMVIIMCIKVTHLCRYEMLSTGFLKTSLNSCGLEGAFGDLWVCESVMATNTGTRSIHFYILITSFINDGCSSRSTTCICTAVQSVKKSQRLF